MVDDLVRPVRSLFPALPRPVLNAADRRPLLIVQMNDVPQDVIDVIHEADVSSHRDVPMIPRRRRQLTGKISGNRMEALSNVRIQSSARLEARFLIG
jgi:hypothetical protein